MESAAKRFEDVEAALGKMLSDLMRELEPLKMDLQGKMGRSFEATKLSYEDNQRALGRALAETANAIRTSGQQYAASDEQAAGQLGQIDSTINLPL